MITETLREPQGDIDGKKNCDKYCHAEALEASKQESFNNRKI